MTTVDRPIASYQYLTLDAVRALSCNGCGDCCDSRRTDGYWTWGFLPADQFASGCDGQALIIPLALVDGVWRDRPAREEDAHELSATRFRCSAFRPDAEGGGSCARHDQWRPPVCGEFPVGGDALPKELAEHGEARLQTDAFPRCTWYHMVVVPEGDPRLSPV
ncbi:MAG: hypothetical protein O2843_08325 [Chloroflexi bacterium]|nr:hypothetical protein [Chloroflexota bacterium]